MIDSDAQPGKFRLGRLDCFQDICIKTKIQKLAALVYIWCKVVHV